MSNHDHDNPMTTTKERIMQSWTTTMPIGPFTVLAEDEVVHASGWTDDVDSLVALMHPSLRPTSVDERGDLGSISLAVKSYVDGDVSAIDDIAVRQSSGDFLTHAWEVLRKIPAGTTLSYAEFAMTCGKPAAVRAAANACARNAAALFVPCHRVVAANGGLHGFRYGLDVKGWLLDHEAGRDRLG